MKVMVLSRSGLRQTVSEPPDASLAKGVISLPSKAEEYCFSVKTPFAGDVLYSN